MDIEILKRLSVQQFLEVSRTGDIDTEEVYAILTDYKISILDDKSNIDIQIQTAKAKAFADNIYSDPEWFRKASDAARYLGRDAQKIQAMLSVLKNVIKKKNVIATAIEIEEKFIQAAKIILDKDTFSAIMSQASNHRL